MPQLGDLFAVYEPAIRRLPRSRPITEADILNPRFALERDARLEIYYAPMDWLRPTARIAIVGITPGTGTMVLAHQIASDGLAAGDTAEAVLRRVKSGAPFSGFRALLTDWLEYLDIHRHLGLSSAAALWEREGERYLHSTSAVRYPALKDGKNYSGRSPGLTSNKVLRRYVLEVLAPELATIPNALVVPLGVAATEATDLLVEHDLLDTRRRLSGFPHPSGANGSKKKTWDRNKEGLRETTDAWFNANPVRR